MLNSCSLISVKCINMNISARNIHHLRHNDTESPHDSLETV